MSNPVSALQGAEFDGIARVQELGLQGMITLRGDFTSKSFKAAVKAVAGCAIPDVRKHSSGKDGRVLAWMSPDELLLMTSYEVVNEDLAALLERLKDEHSLAVNVSDARAVFRVSGANAREVIAKLAPVDMSAAEFGADDFRRTRLAQVAAAFWMSDTDSVDVVCFRSVAQYMFDLLSTVAQPGSEVGAYA
jgi:sarcosine oxidase, subunit gamma